MQKRIVKTIYNIYKVFTFDYIYSRLLQKKQEKRAISLLKVYFIKKQSEKAKILSFLKEKGQFRVDSDGWNILDLAHLFQCNEVVSFIKKNLYVKLHSLEYTFYVINGIFHRKIGFNHTSHNLKKIIDLFLLDKKNINADLSDIEKRIDVFIAKYVK